jgi:hypothetical protein
MVELGGGNRTIQKFENLEISKKKYFIENMDVRCQMVEWCSGTQAIQKYGNMGFRLNGFI